MKKFLYNEAGPNGTPYEKGQWKEFAIHNDNEVKGFFGEYRFLSNFWPAKISLDGIEYPSVEIAYQASKWKPGNRDFFLNCTELESVDYNRKNTPDGFSKEEWDAKRLDVMKGLLKQKFDPSINPENHKKLISTGEKYLEEMNWWGDFYWGTGEDGKGENMLGKLLMEIRDGNK